MGTKSVVITSSRLKVRGGFAAAKGLLLIHGKDAVQVEDKNPGSLEVHSCSVLIVIFWEKWAVIIKVTLVIRNLDEKMKRLLPLYGVALLRPL